MNKVAIKISQGSVVT